jgi:hypothetical protein
VVEVITDCTFSVLLKSKRAQTSENYSVIDVSEEGEKFRWKDGGITNIDAGE